MAQQINLCSPILLTQKRYFSADTMAIALAVFMALGSALAGAWTWNLKQAAAHFEATIQSQAREIDSLKVAIARNKAHAAPVDQALMQQLQARKGAAHEREKLLAALQEGLMAPGAGHSDRLQLLARTIPAQVWITAAKADAREFEIQGYTLEPAALNGWVERLSASPLLQGLRLSDVKVDHTSMATTPSALGERQAWSFHLVHTQPAAAPASAPVPATTPVPANGGKP